MISGAGIPEAVAGAYDTIVLQLPGDAGAIILEGQLVIAGTVLMVNGSEVTSTWEGLLLVILTRYPLPALIPAGRLHVMYPEVVPGNVPMVTGDPKFPLASES